MSDSIRARFSDDLELVTHVPIQAGGVEGFPVTFIIGKADTPETLTFNLLHVVDGELVYDTVEVTNEGSEYNVVVGSVIVSAVELQGTQVDGTEYTGTIASFNPCNLTLEDEDRIVVIITSEGTGTIRLTGVK